MRHVRLHRADDTPPVVVAGGDGIVVAQNRAARRLLEPGTGKYCWDVVGKLKGAEALPCRRGCVVELLAAGMDRSTQAEFKLHGKRHNISCVPVSGAVICVLSPTNNETPQSLQSLSPREREILALLAEGKNTAVVATRLGIGVSTVRTHVQKLRSKLGVRTRAAVVAEGFRLGYLG